MKRIVMGIQIEKREDVAVKVQDYLTKHGCIIKTRLGLHEAGDFCSSVGLIIVDFLPGKDEEVANMLKDLNDIDGVNAKTMEF